MADRIGGSLLYLECQSLVVVGGGRGYCVFSVTIGCYMSVLRQHHSSDAADTVGNVDGYARSAILSSFMGGCFNQDDKSLMGSLE